MPINNLYPDKELSGNFPSVDIEEQISKHKIGASEKKKTSNGFEGTNLIEKVEIILPELTNQNIANKLINSFELSVYKKKITNVSFNINRYYDLDELEKKLEASAKPGKIFIGTLSADATLLVKRYCDRGILFFSFSSDKSNAKDCVYLVNFFPEDDLNALFRFFPKDSKVALLYPENSYGYNINKIIDSIASVSESFIINRASYKEDLTNAREAIKELGKYEFRRLELERQKNILKKKDDDLSRAALKKIQRFETAGNVDFTHLILPDYSIRLLEIAPLLPFYDVDPDVVQFVGTGVWDDKIFFNEPSLQGAIFSGIEEKNRNEFFNDYKFVYKENPIRILTIPYDLIGILSYMLKEKMNLNKAHNLLNSEKIKFDGVDGKFYFSNNIIFRELDILEIKNGIATKLN